jgi:hypothetical protein
LTSALLLIPESENRRYGKDPAGTELYLHVDLPVTGDGPTPGIPEHAGLPTWYGRFDAALEVPEVLARFLESIGLTIHDSPAARFAVQIQARVRNQLGIEEVADFGNLQILTPRRYSVQFDGWAVADPEGKLAGAISKRFLAQLCESVGRTGYDTVLAALPD